MYSNTSNVDLQIAMMQYRTEKQNTDSDRTSTLDSSAASAVRVGTIVFNIEAFALFPKNVSRLAFFFP